MLINGKTAFMMGVDAAEEGLSGEDNPFEDAVEYDLWASGYESVIRRYLEICEDFIFDKFDLGEYNGPMRKV